MKHKHLIGFLYNENCPPCTVRQLKYSFRLDADGLARAIDKVMRSKTFTAEERRWILEQVGK